MKISEDVGYSDFCCEDMEIYSRKPIKAISFDNWWKKVDNDIPTPKATIFPLQKSGLAAESSYSTTRNGPAGYEPVPITYCPFCGKKIEFT